jgi:hypothetical protein
MKNIILILTLAFVSACEPAYAAPANPHSNDIGDNVPVDQIQTGAAGTPVTNYVKRKIAFGVDGTDIDVSSTNPFPVTLLGSGGSGSASVNTGGKAVIASVYNAYASTNVTTSTWTQLVASTSGVINSFDVSDTSGQVMELGIGASPTHLIYIPQGGNVSIIPALIATGTKISIRAVTANATSGFLTINFYQ